MKPPHLSDPPQRSSIRIGTSGWHYNHWKGPFYPEKLPQNSLLDFYSRRFDTVEINNSFYKLPRGDTLRRWRDTVPEGFLFAFKASRYITHLKKLKDPRDSVAKMLKAARQLQPRLGPILFQLPPHWRADADRLCNLLEVLPEDLCYAFEFRDPSWYREDIYTVLRDRGAAFCIYHLEGRLSPLEVTADFVYLRLHGPSSQAYQGSYDVQALAGWAETLTAWQRRGKTVFCYFDNDQAGYAVSNAQRLQDMTGREG